MRNTFADARVPPLFAAALAALGLAQPLPPAASAQSAGVLHVVVVARSTTGRVYCALFRGAEGFPTDSRRAVQTADAPIDASHHATCVFSAIPTGEYAVAAYHDENGNGHIDTNVLGIPQEGVGVSRNAPSQTFGPPRYADAEFQFHGGDEHLMAAIRLRY